jgi:putative cell wall-binding protein
VTVTEAATAPGLFGKTVSTRSGLVAISGVTTQRVSGDDRYGVAIANSQAQFPGASATVPVVYVASGAAFPDALSAGPAAAAKGGALLLTVPDRLPDAVRAEIVRLHPARIVVVGGPATVSQTVVSALGALAPTTRLGGVDRFAVSRAVIDDAFPNGAPTTFVVTGNTYPDALSAGAAAGSTGAPVLLVNGAAPSADAATRAELAKLHTSSVTLVGGTASVSAGVAASLGSGIEVSRLAGADRYTAAIALNKASFTSADTVYLATGLNFPDGLTVSARAGLSHSPLYLVNGECVPQDVIAQIAALHAAKVVILGGYWTMSSYLDALYACA